MQTNARVFKVRHLFFLGHGQKNIKYKKISKLILSGRGHKFLTSMIHRFYGC